MTGKRYYITTLGDWKRHAASFANSHWIALHQQESAAPEEASQSESDATPILLLVEADEGAHSSLEDDSAFEALPHPLSQKPISAAAHAALASHGVRPGASTFEAAETIADIHPLLRHRVF